MQPIATHILPLFVDEITSANCVLCNVFKTFLHPVTCVQTYTHDEKRHIAADQAFLNSCGIQFST